MKIEESRFKNKWVKWGIIPLLLFCVWAVLTLLYIIVLDESFLVVSYSHSKEDFDSLKYTKLLKKDSVSGTFTARANNMGILGLRIRSYARVPYREEDKLVFRIKEKGSPEWYYENIYRSGLMYEFSLFPFGFPIIENSKGKTYQFELESLEGNTENAVSILNREPIFVSKYQETRAYFNEHPTRLPFFVLKKVGNYTNSIDVQFSSFVYMLPLIFYMITVSPIGVRLMSIAGKLYPPLKKIDKNPDYYLFGIIISFVILLDIMYLQIQNDAIYIVVGILSYVVSRVYKVGSKIALVVFIALLVLSFFLYYTEQLQVAERSASWAYLFLVIASIQMMSEMKNGNNLVKRKNHSL